MKQHSNFNQDFSQLKFRSSKDKPNSLPDFIFSASKVTISLSLLLFSVGILFFSLSNADEPTEKIVEVKLSLTKDKTIIEPLSLPLLSASSEVIATELNTKIVNQQNTLTIDKLANNNTDKINTNSKNIEYTIKPGDSLALIFKKHNLSKKLLHKIIYSSQHGKQLAHIKPGQKITFTFNQKEQLQSVLLQKDKIESLQFIRQQHTDQKKQKLFVSSVIKKEIEKRQRFVNVTINGSLFLSATKAGLSDNFTMELAQLFGWDIDFALNIRNGDSFSILYNELFVDNEKVGNGQILVAEFINQGKAFQSIYFTDKSGKSDYYNMQGYSKRKAFLRTPVAFSRISSRFSTGRRHPVLNHIRAHKGVDYASPRGTPIKAAGDGKISFKGRKGGYGRVVQIQHGSKYMTVYAHMSSFAKKIKRGSKVKQGQIIGYVGSSGLATGPHLHYEFRVNGVHRNPLKVTLPKANPINKSYRKRFLQHSENMISSLKLKKHKQIALLKQ
ncbi:MAG: peptidoglycan DD-metalloendopeptidase family protein [Pseudomonadota bacterium]